MSYFTFPKTLEWGHVGDLEFEQNWAGKVHHHVSSTHALKKKTVNKTVQNLNPTARKRQSRVFYFVSQTDTQDPKFLDLFLHLFY